MFELDDHDRTEKIHEEMMDLALERHRFELYVDWAAFRIAIDDREGGLEKLRQASEAADSRTTTSIGTGPHQHRRPRGGTGGACACERPSLGPEEMPPKQGASYTQLVTLAVVHGRLGFEEQGKAQLRALIRTPTAMGCCGPSPKRPLSWAGRMSSTRSGSSAAAHRGTAPCATW